MPTKQELRDRKRNQRESGAIEDAAETPIDILDDLADGDVGSAVRETVRAPFRLTRKLLTFDWF